MERIAAVVAAAGQSRRMGQPKLRLALGGETILHRALREISKATFAEIVVVLGDDREALQETISGFPVRVVVNQAFQQGLGSSLRAGVGAVSNDCEAAIIALADRPLVTAAMYETLIAAHVRTNASIVASRFGGVVAPPTLFVRRLFPEVGTDAVGARSLVQRHESDVVFVDLPPEGLTDVDTPEEYELLRGVMENNS